MIPTEEPKEFPWFIRLMFFFVGLISVPVLLIISFVNYLKRKWNEAA